MQKQQASRGVNLGNWLVLEKWMSPELFADTSAEDEWHLWRELGDVERRERFKVHRDSYITDRDFAYLARRGIDFVRIPVPFFIFGDDEPYIGCIEYLDRAFTWAGRYGIKILIDLHTVPDSQNGFDNGGINGVCKFHKNPQHVEFALSVLERLAARYRDRTNLWGIEVLNEPVSQEMWELINVPKRYPAADPADAAGSEPVPTAFLKRFYQEAYARIRAQSDTVPVVFHDGFRMNEWIGFFREPDFRNILLDTHMYVMMHTITNHNADLDDYVAHIDRTFGGTLKAMAEDVPILVGEWCLDTASPRAAGLTGKERRDYYRTIAEAHFRAWEHASAWCYWSYKLHVDTPDRDVWDMGKAMELGFLPADV